MSASLPPVIERELGRWARELGAGDGGLLMVAVGSSAKRRLAIETRLEELLEGWELAPLVVGGECGDPWAAVPAGGGRTLVSLAGVLDCDDPEGTLAALNLGREHLRRGAPSLVLWVGAIENLDRLQRKAPDLWSYRRRVGWFLSADDFEGGAIEIDERQDMGKQIAELRARLDGLPEGHAHRIELLFDLAWHLDAREDHSGQASVLSEVASLIDRTPQFRERLIRDRADLAARRIRLTETLEWTRQLVSSTRSTVPHGGAAALRYRARFHETDQVWRRVRDLGTHTTVGSVNQATLWVCLGDLTRASECCHEAERHLEGYRRRYDMSALATRRAMIAIQRLDSYGAVSLLLRAWTLARSISTSIGLAKSLCDLLRYLRMMGLLDDAERLCSAALRHATSDTQTTALSRELVMIEACQDLSRAERARRDALVSASSLLETCPDWRRAPICTEKFELLRLELGEPVDHDACLATLDRLIYVALDQRQYDLAQWARLQQVELYLELQRFALATSVADIALRWSLEHEGPSRHAERHLDLAKLHRAQAQLDAAAAEIDTAEQLLAAEVPLYQPRETWKKILIERHHLALARNEPPAALAALERGLAFAREAGVRAIELELLHLVAELPDHPETDPSRERAARDAVELARDAMLVFEEARALANLSLIASEPERARRLLQEARFLAPVCPLERAHKRLEAAAARLEP